MTRRYQSKGKRRLFLLDIMRVVCAFLIFARHSITMYGCAYSPRLDAWFLDLTSPVMTCFFLLSGFSIHYQHGKEETTASWTRTYLIKRLITIMPSYLLVVLLWPLAHPDQIKDCLVLFPIEVLGIQTSYRTLFGILHNGGTWFVSCMICAYICYPIIKSVLNSGKRYTAPVMIVVVHFIFMYSFIVIARYTLDGFYSNPIARTGEFMIGAAFAQVLFTDKGQSDHETSGAAGTDRMPLYLIVCLSIISVVLAVANHMNVRTTFFAYLPIPVILLCLYLASLISCPPLERSKILSILSGISYQFFLTQLFLWDITTWVMHLFGFGGNRVKILTSLLLCTLISLAAWRFYDKPVRKYLMRHFIRRI